MNQERPKVLITNRFDEKLRLKLQTIKSVEFTYKNHLFEEEESLAEIQGLIIRSSTQVDKDFLGKFPKLRFVVTATSGFDHLDLKAANARDVRCFHVPETQTEAASELTLLHILGACRKMTLATSQLQKGDWQRSLLLGRQLSGRQLGVIGLGRVGRRVAEKALALGMKVWAYDPYITEHDPQIPMAGFEELMRASDVISLHVPKTTRTRHMIKRETLSWMAPDAILVNMSRGDVINEPDLIQHLQENPQFVAGLDVFAKEPLVTKSPLLQMPNVILTPHVGASTYEALEASSKVAIGKMIDLFQGKMVPGELPPKARWYEESL